MRLIDADKLYLDCMTWNGTLAISQNQIANAPTVEERPKGKWIRITNSTAPTQMWNCSECGRTVEKNTVLDPDIFFPFCHCGADMRGDK